MQKQLVNTFAAEFILSWIANKRQVDQERVHVVILSIKHVLVDD
jgi:hypothetical protein